MSYQGCPPNVQNELCGREATNDRRESALGGTTHRLQKYGRIGIRTAAAVSVQTPMDTSEDFQTMTIRPRECFTSLSKRCANACCQ